MPFTKKTNHYFDCGHQGCPDDEGWTGFENHRTSVCLACLSQAIQSAENPMDCGCSQPFISQRYRRDEQGRGFCPRCWEKVFPRTMKTRRKLKMVLNRQDVDNSRFVRWSVEEPNGFFDFPASLNDSGKEITVRFKDMHGSLWEGTAPSIDLEVLRYEGLGMSFRKLPL